MRSMASDRLKEIVSEVKNLRASQSLQVFRPTSIVVSFNSSDWTVRRGHAERETILKGYELRMDCHDEAGGQWTADLAGCKPHQSPTHRQHHSQDFPRAQVLSHGRNPAWSRPDTSKSTEILGGAQ